MNNYEPMSHKHLLTSQAGIAGSISKQALGLGVTGMANTQASFGARAFNTTGLSRSNLNTMIPEAESSQGSMGIKTDEQPF